MTTLRTQYTLEEPRLMAIDGYPFGHELRVALPPSYASSDRSYPVLWVTDNALETALTTVGGRELIIVAVGSVAGSTDRPHGGRAYDFYPQHDISQTGPIGEYLRALEGGDASPHVGGGAPRFRDFLIDQARPALAADYRMDPVDHALEGCSAGGWFTLYTMFTRPGAFSKYIAGAPALYYCQDLIWRIEEEYAAAHDDLVADLFLATGDAEMTTDFIFSCFSAMAKMIERLSFRAYPSLKLRYKILLGETHASCLPHVLSSGVRELWGDSIVAHP